MPSVRLDPESSARSHLIAHQSNKPLGWALITHPYHPFFGQNFRILKRRLVAGRETVILEGTERGTFAVLQEWTDQARPSLAATGLLNIEHLVELIDLIKALKQQRHSKRN